jgi:carbon-monoxide dehydrogenase large subunit
VRFEDVEVVNGDTGLIPLGMGTFASRSGVVTSNAVRAAALAVREKALTAAAQLLEAARDDLDLQDGVVSVRGAADRSISLARIAQIVSAPSPAFPFPRGLQPGLEELVFWKLEGGTPHGGGAHVAIVEVDLETGELEILRYVVVHDCGRMLNPMVVEGQIHGATAQGLGTALLEDVVYDDSGQLVTASFMDYLLPTACDLPTIEQGHQETPSELNPEGVRPMGEGSSSPVAAVIASAVEDALRPFGVRVHRVPVTPESIRSLLRTTAT